MSDRLRSGHIVFRRSDTILHSHKQGRGVLISPHSWTRQLAMPMGCPVDDVKPVQGEMGLESRRSKMKLKDPSPRDCAKQWVCCGSNCPTEVGKRRRNQPRKARKRSPGDLLSWEPRKESPFGRREKTGHV